jgi:hypothetical protein
MRAGAPPVMRPSLMMVALALMSQRAESVPAMVPELMMVAGAPLPAPQ